MFLNCATTGGASFLAAASLAFRAFEQVMCFLLVWCGLRLSNLKPVFPSYSEDDLKHQNLTMIETTLKGVYFSCQLAEHNPHLVLNFEKKYI
jgi:hypothetical protein